MIYAYSDGSSRGNPGPGGYGAVIFNKQNEIIYTYQKQEKLITNNQAELKAILHVFSIMQTLYPDEHCIIYSDSSYCVNICNDWIYSWARNNWMNSKKRIIENIELIKELYKYLNIDFFNCEVKKCSGHSGIIGNELADALATKDLNRFKLICKENQITILPNIDINEIT